METKKRIVVCGDSFNIGIGCTNLHTQPYGTVAAQMLGWDLVNLARGSASNYTIFMQAKYAVEMQPRPDLIVIGVTSYDRIEWVREGKPELQGTSLLNLNYHQYPPHQCPQPHHDAPLDFHVSDKGYDPCILSEQIVALDEYIKNPKMQYYERLKTEPVQKAKLIRDYYLSVMDYEIKRNYDIGMVLQAYTYARRNGINCIVMSDDPKLTQLIDACDLLPNNWFTLSNQYPDTIGSLHASPEAHQLVAERLVAKIKESKYD